MAEQRAYIPEVYGRRQGKPLKSRQAALIETLLPKIAVPDPEQGPIDLAALFPGKEEFWLEVGFGGGEHLAFQAARNPRVGMIGAEPYVNGVGKLLVLIDERGLDNVRIRFGDARPLLAALHGGALARLFVLHPDPWPKRRHFKRRLVSPWFFAEAARLIRPGGELRVATDAPDYLRWTLMHAQRARGFEWAAERRADWTTRPEDWPQTRYEAKALKEGRLPVYLIFRRR